MRRLLTAFLVAMIALPVSLGFAAKKNAPLKVGDKGWKVKTVQTKLNTLGLKTPLTGKYSRDLEKQVRIFQKTHKLPVQGRWMIRPISASMKLLLKKRESMASRAKMW